ncbi:MAG: hypothetical protein B6D39_10060 [Anaerolineae bacterium UTCFX2]|jgi:phospholipase/carboxylesterase|nr:hypothetical protein [Anaerolineales bacterium]OQY89302.1 MAG: hypothetical protein B6D39_10060 [Anaerolineae bacterium UTCFX2]
MGPVNRVEENILFDEIDGVKFKYRLPPANAPVQTFLLLHGWTGDEDSMWIFSSRLSQNALLIAPRGLYASPFGGYSWYSKTDAQWPVVKDFAEGIAALKNLLENDLFSMADKAQFRVVGFSQGAALAYSLAFSQAIKIQALCGLSGFVPQEIDASYPDKPLDGLPIFVAHGAKDRIVSVERARSGIRVLEQAGALVTYCEDDVGHKLSAACFRGMQEFFRRI